jgi:hypothetical protein
VEKTYSKKKDKRGVPGRLNNFQEKPLHLELREWPKVVGVRNDTPLRLEYTISR